VNPAVSRAATAAFTVEVASDSRYQVHFEPGLRHAYGALLRREVGDATLFVLTDRRVSRLHGEAFLAGLRSAGYAPQSLVVAEGERSKSLETFGRLLHKLIGLECDRRSIIVCFGGGVVSDLGGFVAASYMRGIRYVNFATSLLGQIDACVGGKVAVNLPEAKNVVGAFHHPTHVAGDPECLLTLSQRDFKSGMAEGIKVAILDGPEYFSFLEGEGSAIRSRSPEHMTRVVATAARLKMRWISADPYEKDLRRPLNFGHTLGHPIETEFQYRGIRHGEAVAIGMGVATAIALDKGLIDPAEAERILDLLAAYDLLGYDEPIRPDAVIEHMRVVRLVRGRKLNFVLPIRIGEVLVTDELETRDIVLGFERYQRIVEERRA
jgi:3-dehydroquinate synthase